MTQWNFEWITDWKTIWSGSFQGQWREWLEQSWSSHVFFYPSLVRAWVETYLPLRDIQPLFLVARQKETTIFFPLILWRRNWKNAFLREVIPAGNSDFDYHDPIVSGPPGEFDPESFWGSLITELERNNILFERLSLPGITEKVAGTGRNWSVGDVCPYIDISRFKIPEDFLPALRKSLRGDLRRQIRRLEEQGELTFHVFAKDDLGETVVRLPRFLDAHAQRWPKAYKAPHFHENILRFGLSEGLVHFSELRLDSQPISWHMGFIDRQRFYYYLPAADSKFEKFSPAKVHLLKCVEEAIRLGLSVYDHLRGRESYKAGWTDNLAQLHNCTVIAGHASSRFKLFMVDKVKPKLLSGR